MKKSKKIALIVSAICLAVGIIIGFAAAVMVNFDFDRMATVKFEDKSTVISEDFCNIEIKGVECDIKILPSNDGECRVFYSDSEKIKTDISVSDGTLKIKRRDVRKWYDNIGIWIADDITVKVYLPRDEYGKLNLKTVSGDIGVRNLRFNEIDAGSTSGDIECEDVISLGSAVIKTVSGDIGLDNFDSENITAKTVSGDIEAEVLSAKNFDVNTVSGEVNVPPSDKNAGTFKAKTTSGDIEIDVIG